ncbi:MAG TPA: hypothetical protein PLB36_02495 [Bacillota bacterium]|nr:hypothetical protein [Bacillota bacterium]HOK64455.1 hypothetical protein [Bacillota bacterium]HOL11741.1 hypothetical protein [Bacillota bacterium]HOQ02345.1 hypothetical protein [Bacillota bacterium]HPP60790.1 hypothetical protein [Bacillota bacterium]
MKKIVYFILLLVFTFSLIGCSTIRNDKNVAEDMSSDDNIVIAVINDCDDDLYYIHCEYYLSNTPIGGWRVAILEGIPFAMSEIIVHDLIAEDFPEKSDLSTMRVEFFAGLKNDQEFPAGEPIEIHAEFGNIYYFSLSGSKSAGFEVTSIEKP